MSTTIDPALVPGAMQETKVRALADGSIVEFEFAPYGWLTKAGEPRQKDWRAYFVTTPDGKRSRVPSVTTLLDAILPKGGLPPWYEARGIEGAVEAVRLGHIDPAAPVGAVETVRSLRLGADRAKDDAAGRGLNVHAVLERYAETGAVPDLADHPAEEWGYVQGLTRWLLKAQPEPVAIEQLVASREHGYAGRFDLKARIGGFTTLVDLKTQQNAGIYESAHLQARMYEMADRECGGEECAQVIVVVVAENGEFREMACAASEGLVTAALTYYRELRPVTSACASANRIEKKARRA